MKTQNKRVALAFVSLLIAALFCTNTLFASDVKNYQVELLVFQHLYPNGSPEGEPRIKAFDDYPSLINFNSVEKENLVLSEDAQRIRGSRNFRLLKHIAWSQEGLSKEEAGSINLARWLPDVNGTVALYLNRYLHLDILLEKQFEDGQKVVLRERRRMRSKETHYLDNPRLGIIARITPLDN